MSTLSVSLTALLLSTILCSPASTRADEFAVTQFTSKEGDELTTTWSPDGEWLAFSAEWTGNREIWKKPLAGGEAVQLTDDRAHDSYTVWSPDGTRLAFSSNRGDTPHIYTISASGGDLHRVTGDEDRVYFHHEHGCPVTWSPDSESIAFLSHKGDSRDIWIIPSGGGEARQLTQDRAGEEGPAWSPDGQQIAFGLGPNPDISAANDDMWVVSAGGGISRQLTTFPGHDGVPSWSPNGEWIAFQSSRGRSGMDIWVMPSSGGTARQITELGDAYVPRWSPDGNRIAFHRTPRRGATNIFIADVSGLQSAVENIPHQRIAGLVTLEGEPAPGAIVEAKDADGVAYRATTSTDGRYQIWAEPGSYEVSLPGAEGADPVSLTINSGESQEEIDFAPTALEQTYPTWPFQTAIVVIGLATLVCVIPLYSRRTRLGSLVVSPKRAFEEIAAEPDWVGPFFIALGATLVIAVAFVGAFLPMFGTSGGPGIFPLIMMTVVPVITLVAMFLAALANWIIRAGAVWLLAQLFGKQTRFYPVLSAVGYAFMPEMLVGSLLMAVFIGAGITEFTIPNAADMAPPTSLLWLLQGSGEFSMAAQHLLAELELFALWSLALTVVAVQRAYVFTVAKAAAVVGIYWVGAIAVVAGFIAMMAEFWELTQSSGAF